MQFRPIDESDVPALFAVRTATRENPLSRGELARMGITEASVMIMLRTSHRGWLCEEAGRVLGFAMGNRETGEMWVIAVLPEHERRGIGLELLARVEDALFAAGRHEIWLTTDIDPALRAYGFYCSRGWSDWKTEDGLRYMRKRKQSGAPPPAGGAP